MVSPATGYEPLDVLKPAADDVWVVDSGPIHAFGLALPVRMTVIRLSDGAMWMHSPTRHDGGLQRAIGALGPIRHLVAPSVSHWRFLPDWQAACPEALTWGVPNLGRRRAVRRAGVRIDRELTDAPPPEWDAEIGQTVVPGMAGFQEAAFFHRASRSLLLTDLVVNLDPARLPQATRPAARLLGMTAPDGRAAAYVRVLVRLKGDAARVAAARLLAWSPERAIFAHGAWFERDATDRLRRSLRWVSGR